MNQQNERDFRVAFGQFKDLPGYDAFFADFDNYMAEYPDRIKPSDLPIAKLFPGIDWEDMEEVGIILKNAVKIQSELHEKHSQSASVLGVSNAKFVSNLINELAQYKIIAMMLQAKLGPVTNLPKDPRRRFRVVP